MSKTFTLTSASTQERQSRGYLKKSPAFWFLLLLLAVFTAGCEKDDYKDEIVGVCPVVVSTDPSDKDVDVVLDKLISATFNTDMDSATINKTTFIIKQGTTLISGTVATTASGKTFTFKPDEALLPFTVYTGTITTGAKEPLHTALAKDYTWTFTTIPQLALSASPEAGGTVAGAGVFAQGAAVTVMATPRTGYSFVKWTENGITVATTASYRFAMAGNKALAAIFSEGPSFTVTVSANPEAGGTAVGEGIFGDGTSVNVSAAARTGYTFVNWTENNVPVSASANYTFRLTANRTLVANFELISTSPAGPGTVNLGTAANFTILTESGITNVSTSAITGNIGVSPITGAAITGLACSEVIGEIYTRNAAGPECRVIDQTRVDNAVGDMRRAFIEANGLVDAPIVEYASGNLNSQTLAPGLYKWGTGVSITDGITLSGGANDTWVFQIAQDLVVNNSAKITLAGGAQARNIVWVVSGQVVLGTYVDFSGIVLSKNLISLNTGAKVTGRLLAQKNVTLIKNTVKQP
jgi:hypothetical protein